jgi:hypothetical protein
MMMLGRVRPSYLEEWTHGAKYNLPRNHPDPDGTLVAVLWKSTQINKNKPSFLPFKKAFVPVPSKVYILLTHNLYM